jgi:hypothetical protein
MNTGGEAAEQIVRMSLEGFEIAARISGAGAKNIAILLYAILKEEKKTKGKARLTNMLRSGKELKVFTVKNAHLARFTKEAKKYGVLYCVLADRKNKDPYAEVDVIARAEDAPKISRIVERFHLASIDTASITAKSEKNKDEYFLSGENTTDIPSTIEAPQAEEKEALLNALMGEPEQPEENIPNPLPAETEKPPLSEPGFGQQEKFTEGVIKPEKEKASVKEELQKIRESRTVKKKDSPSKEKTASNRRKNNRSTSDKKNSGKSARAQKTKRHKTKSKEAR